MQHRSFNHRHNYSKLWVGLIVVFILWGLMVMALPTLNEFTNNLINP